MSSTQRKDGRVSPPLLFKKRKHVISLYKRGQNVMAIVKATGLCWRAVRVAIDAYERGGIEGIRPAKRGRRLGTSRTLSAEQEQQIQRDICSSRPDQLELDSALWTRESVRAYMKKNFQVDMPSRTVGEYLNRWGFPPQKPVWANAEQRSEAVKEWLKTEYPELLRRAKHEHAEIHWASELPVITEAVRVKLREPRRGRKPTKYTSLGARHSMISSINNQGKCYWMITEGGFSASKFTEFLRSIIKVASQKAFVVIDNLNVRYTNAITGWLEMHKDDIELFQLPNGKPEPNQAGEEVQSPEAEPAAEQNLEVV